MTVEVCPYCDIAGCHHIRSRASAEAYLRGEAEWGPWRSDISEWNVTTHDVRFECVGGIHKISTRPRVDLIPRPAEPAQAAQDWEAIRAKMLSVEDAINEPPKMWAEEPLEVREYRHHLYRIWSPLCAALIAAAKGGDQ